MRQYIVQSWVGAAEDSYSGEQIGNRHSRSVDVTDHITGVKRNAKAKRNIMDKVDLANRHMNRMELMSTELESDFDNGCITLEEYSRGRRIMDERLDKAFKRVAKQEGWKDELSQDEQTPAYAWMEDRTAVGTSYDEKDSIFLTLPVDNCFRMAYDWLQKAKSLFKD